MASVFQSLVCFWLVLFSTTSTAVSKDELLVRAEKVQDDSALVLALTGAEGACPSISGNHQRVYSHWSSVDRAGKRAGRLAYEYYR